MNCPSCGAPLRVSGETLQCDYCRTVVVPDKTSDGVTVLSEGEAGGDACPLCNVVLASAALAGSTILYCQQCTGMLISMDVFPALLQTLRAQQTHLSAPPPASSADLQRHIGCPHCHRSMDTHFYAGGGNVVVDSCDACDLLWLDHGELLRIARTADNDFDDSQYAADTTADFTS